MGTAARLAVLRRVTRSAWLAVVLPPASATHGEARAVGRSRRLADRRAARLARALALRAAALQGPLVRVSLSHSTGAGAALVASPGAYVGVDVMPVGRVAWRHVVAVTTADERARVAALDPEIAAAVVWAAKEAGAKASILRKNCSPLSIRIAECDADADGGTMLLGTPGGALLARWEVAEDFLYAWAVRDS